MKSTALVFNIGLLDKSFWIQHIITHLFKIFSELATAVNATKEDISQLLRDMGASLQRNERRF